MARKIQGGLPKVVKIISDDELAENGGKYVISTNIAIPVVVRNDVAQTIGGNVGEVAYVISQAELDSGKYKLSGGASLQVVDDSEVDRKAISGTSVTPIFVISGSFDVGVFATSASVEEGVSISGSVDSTKSCSNNAEWTIEETASGINVQFTFHVQGKAKKVKVKGKSTTSQSYILEAWNGTSWDMIDNMAMTETENEYTAVLGDEHTVGNVVDVRVFRSSGNNQKLIMNCIALIADGPSTPIPGDGGAAFFFFF